MSAQKTAEQEQARAALCIAEGCVWYQAAGGLSADLTRFADALDTVRDEIEQACDTGMRLTVPASEIVGRIRDILRRSRDAFPERAES